MRAFVHTNMTFPYSRRKKEHTMAIFQQPHPPKPTCREICSFGGVARRSEVGAMHSSRTGASLPYSYHNRCGSFEPRPRAAAPRRSQERPPWTPAATAFRCNRRGSLVRRARLSTPLWACPCPNEGRLQRDDGGGRATWPWRRWSSSPPRSLLRSWGWGRRDAPARGPREGRPPPGGAIPTRRCMHPDRPNLRPLNLKDPP
mmetsp:Transcript_12025/g.19256  ORF Transcript_12025/g.19256 Transcript_12025/m.19256 type:complete len:201 (+) Transcript_12025:67-669(+)